MAGVLAIACSKNVRPDTESGASLSTVAMGPSDPREDRDDHSACGGIRTFEVRRAIGDVSPGYDLRPVTARRFSDERVHNMAIVGAVDAGARCVLFFDSAVEGPAWELKVARSRDRGATWQLIGEIRKPDFLALFEEARFETDREGCVTLVRDDETTRSCTEDGGATWLTR